MLDEILKRYNEAVYDTDRDQAKQVVQEALDAGATPEQIVFEVVIPSIEQMMSALSEHFDANLAQHFMTAQIASEITEAMVARFKAPPDIIGLAILGTAQDDLHSLGKRIVAGCLRSMLIDVIDIGVNVPPERFVDEAVAHNAQVIGVSAMMVHTARGESGPKAVRRILKERGLEDKIKLVVGGAPFRFDAELYKVVGADAWAPDGLIGAKIIADLIKGVRS